MRSVFWEGGPSELSEHFAAADDFHQSPVEHFFSVKSAVSSRDDNLLAKHQDGVGVGHHLELQSLGARDEHHSEELTEEEDEGGVDGEDGVLSEEGGRDLGVEGVEADALSILNVVSLREDPVVLARVRSSHINVQTFFRRHINELSYVCVVKEDQLRESVLELHTQNVVLSCRAVTADHVVDLCLLFIVHCNLLLQRSSQSVRRSLKEITLVLPVFRSLCSE